MTVLFTPWYRRIPTRSAGTCDQPGSAEPTAILDHRSSAISHLVKRSHQSAGSDDPVAILREGHSIIRDEVRAVYALEERTPVSHVFSRGFGSCSQRLAVLESVARALGIQTRVRALLIDRSFWYPRFPRTKFALPDQMLLAWPEFRINQWKPDQWTPASELFGSIGCRGGGSFTNSGSETLFEAVGRCAVDWDGREAGGTHDLSHFIRADHGYFANRDDAFAVLGQTLCGPSRLVADPLLRRISA
ncbi:transglutaminase domain-containing protein [Nesterenkonia sp. Act20]|uniref:transglutaminase domain-containing protein n=1 Tax=Nesterenkonia sp. Act20 TaxID=1483432 RepID=UPI00210045C9|nr:transglutaminase domain-containing protein [Nesterenkonia sp. Act20]